MRMPRFGAPVSGAVDDAATARTPWPPRTRSSTPLMKRIFFVGSIRPSFPTGWTYAGPRFTSASTRSCCANPRSIRVACTKLTSSSPAPTSSACASASSPTTSAWWPRRTRRWPATRWPMRPRSFAEVRAVCIAGPRPNTIAVSSVIASVNGEHGRIDRDLRRAAAGSAAPPTRSARTPAIAKTRPAMPPGTAMISVSISSCRTMRDRSAPSA